MKISRNLTTAIIISIVFLLLWNISVFAYQCGEIRSDVLRLHILANSDSEEDQKLKLKVRDEILKTGYGIFNGSVCIENAVEKITPQINKIKETAEQVIKDNGYDYKVTVTLENEYFSTRVYNDSITLPAGKYLALKVIIGNGQGKNWWCVMFPALCLPAVESNQRDEIDKVLNTDEEEIILDSSKYEVRFKIVELIESLKEKVDNRLSG